MRTLRHQNNTVRWHKVARLQLDHIPGNENCDRQRHRRAIAADVGVDGHQAFQRLRGVLRPVLLEHVKSDGQDDDNKDD